MKSKRVCREEEEEDLEDLIVSDFHDYFDGVMTIDGDTGIGDIPMIAM